MTTMQTIVEASYLRSTRNAPGKSAVDAEMIGVIGRAYVTYYLLLADASPERFRSEVLVTLLGAPASASIPASVHDLVKATSATGEEVTIIPAAEAARSWHLAPALVWIGTNLRSRGQTDDPVSGDTITLLVLAGATLPTALTDTLDARFTDSYTELLILEGAVYLAIKDANRDPQEREALKAERAAQRATFARNVGLTKTALEALLDDAVPVA